MKERVLAPSGSPGELRTFCTIGGIACEYAQRGQPPPHAHFRWTAIIAVKSGHGTGGTYGDERLASCLAGASLATCAVVAFIDAYCCRNIGGVSSRGQHEAS